MKNKIKLNTNLLIIIIYKILSFDLLFYYAISYLFLVNVKQLTTSQIVFADSFYPVFKLILQVPCTILIQKIGKKKSLILANFSCSIYGLLMLLVIGPSTIIIGNFFLALSLVIKGMAEPTFLYDIIKTSNSQNKNNLFSKYESISTSCYYFLDAVTSVIAGFIYIFNPYLPLIFSCLTSVTATILTCMLKEEFTSKITEYINIKNEFLVYNKNLIQAFKCILNSSRLRALIFFNSLITSIFYIMLTLQRSLLTDVNIPSEKFGIIFAIMGIIACFSTSQSNYIHNKFHNKTLSILVINFIFSIIISALVVLSNLPLFLIYYILLLMTAIQYFIRGPYLTLIKRYFNSFCDSSDMRLKIYSIKALFEYVSSTLIAIICSNILENFSNSITCLIFGIFSFIIAIVLIFYMHSRVGLKPEEYSKEDIFS